MTPTLADRVLAGDPRAIARAISLVENEDPSGAELVRDLFSHTGHAYLIGVTGPPGAGKSTLVDGLTAELRRRGRSIGILAVDPSSPFTGGAVLGDRVRMQDHAGDGGVFIRSMATRGHLGGLARATGDASIVLDAAGKDVVLIETVGVGQDEIDIIRTADLSVVVLVPGTGDDVQALKAGIMEIADLFVVNKADRDGADRLVSAVEATLALHSYGAAEWRPPVIQTVATRREGIVELANAIERFRGHTSQDQVERRRERIAYRLRELASERFMTYLERKVVGEDELAAVVDRIARRELDPYTAAGQLLSSALGSAPPDADATSQPGAHLRAVLDHIGIAVTDIDAALEFYRDALGLEVEGSELVDTQQVRAHFVAAGSSSLELLEATADTSPIARYLARRGPGLHHITLRVPDLAIRLAELKARGVRLIDERPRPGAEGALVAFIHPASAHGVLVELKQSLAPRRSSDVDAGPAGRLEAPRARTTGGT